MMSSVSTKLIVCLIISSFSAFSQENWGFGPFVKPNENPIAGPDSTFIFFCPEKKQLVQRQKADVFNPAAIVRDGKVYLFPRCEDNPEAIIGGRTSRIGIAVSEDGIHFKKFPEPVLYPGNDSLNIYDTTGGCEDPRIVETPEGGYVMTFTAWNMKVPNLSVAFSKDLFHWQKRGPAFAKTYNGRYLNNWSKSGSIITRMVNDRLIAAKINGKNATDGTGTTDLPKGTYSVGEALFDLTDPSKLTGRKDKCVLKPTLPHEVSGQYKSGDTFSEGLVFFKKKWFLYYGTADSFIGLAIAENHD